MNPHPKIAIVAGEPSGDALGAGLIIEILKIQPKTEFYGIGGPKMRCAGSDNWFDMARIELMGIDGLFDKLPDILRIRKTLCQALLRNPPDLFIGVDVPDFNLTLEKKLQKKGIKTIHYVSPTVWAWRGYRIHKIRQAVSHMLVLFPFEARYYNKHGIPVTCVGHPIADEIDQPDKLKARVSLGLSENTSKTLIALLPGSRRSEVTRLALVFIKAADQIYKRDPQISFVLPFANPSVKSIFENLTGGISHLPITCYQGNSRQTMEAADIVVLASGTAALEAALLGRPMVMVYKVSRLMYWLFKKLRHVKHYCMPNHLLDSPEVPELIQKEVTADNIEKHVFSYLSSPQKVRNLEDKFFHIRQQLKRNASSIAAQVVLDTLADRQ